MYFVFQNHLSPQLITLYFEQLIPFQIVQVRGRRGRDRMVVGYHH